VDHATVSAHDVWVLKGHQLLQLLFVGSEGGVVVQVEHLHCHAFVAPAALPHAADAAATEQFACGSSNDSSSSSKKSNETADMSVDA
jgi:hypothetical protein